MLIGGGGGVSRVSSKAHVLRRTLTHLSRTAVAEMKTRKMAELHEAKAEEGGGEEGQLDREPQDTKMLATLTA